MKFIIKLLGQSVGLFERVIVSRIKVEWLSQTIYLLTNRLKAIADVLTDENIEDKDQLEAVARQTLLTPEFQKLQATLFALSLEKIDNPVVTKLFVGTEGLRSNVFLALGDDNFDNKEQIEGILSQFSKSEEFDELVIALVTILADKYAKNEALKEFILTLIENLVNSDDVN